MLSEITLLHVQVEMELTDLQIGQHYKTWYRLQHQEPKQKDKKCVPGHRVLGFSVSVPPRKEMGSLRLKVQCREERILEATLYTPFVQLMLAAVENPSVSLDEPRSGSGVHCLHMYV